MKRISKTKIKNRTKKKTSPSLIETIKATMKNQKWNEVGKILASSSKRFSSLNLFQIDRQSSSGDTVVVIGKVLSGGELTKKIKICALSISERTKEKLKESKSEFLPILEEINKNPKAEGIKVLR
ncbi:50S ribosomal protein L18e [Candidatus Pacearchaeota archaeon]|nr:50S ribosomal protein L18e [Candidatus Pacearchaeota archaeon]